MKKAKERKFEITQEQYEQNLRDGADPEYAPLPGKYVGRRGSFLARHPEMKPKKVRVNIHLDEDIVDYFKQRASEPNAAPYQRQINQALRKVIADNPTAESRLIEALLHDKNFITRLAKEVKPLLK